MQYPSKWKGEYEFGKIRFLSYDKRKNKWIADILPLTEGKSNNVNNYTSSYIIYLNFILNIFDFIIYHLHISYILT